MKVIKVIDFLVEKFLGEFNGDIFVPDQLNQSETLINIMRERLNKLENEDNIEANFKKLSKEQEIKFIKNLILRLESER